MAKRRIGSGIVAVGIVAALTGAVAYTTMGESDVEAVPVVESAPPVDARPTPEAEVDADRGDSRVQLAPPEAPELLAVGLPSLEPTTMAAASASPSASQYSVPAVDLPTGALLSQPVSGRKTSRFGNRFHPILRVWKLHTGLDFAAACGTPVGAAAAGKVTKVGWAGGNGMQVRVDHGRIGGHHVVTTYNHLSAVGVRVGQQVAVHQGVGRVGNTGYSTGCHLHFEVIANGWYTNPEQWLNGEAVDIDTSQMNNRPAATPTASATASPTPSPTPSATLPPSSTPSPTATASPSPTPTTSPEPSCSPRPTADPTAGPTADPTTDPCGTPEPSCAPSPSAGPGADPSAGPTAQPCGTPQPSCSESPAPGATAAPGETPQPCASPTADPSNTPDPTETGSETPEPTDSPSGTPSTQPTDEPSETATPEPSEPAPSPSGTTPSPSGTAPSPSGTAPSPSGSSSGTITPSADDVTPSGTYGHSASASARVTGTQDATHTPGATPTATSESTATAG
ncbi:hypothetical protein GCM10028820_01250 [Tessaracoccus terricola]